MMDAENDDPIEMIATLARSMMAERRGRFLDAACGGDPKLCAEVEAKLGTITQHNDTTEPESKALPDQIPNQESDPFNLIESIALEALSEAPGSIESRQAVDNGNAAEEAVINAYCDEKQLDTRARLRLFQDVCRIIDQDHRCGIIHGTLTSRNVSVLPDGSIRVSRQERSDQSADALLKAGYASPEQVLGEPVTTATDVYQLGVLLYELLTGRAPYRLHSQDADELCKAISEQAPERPSLVVIQPDQSAEVAVRIARARQVSPPELQRLLGGDLELIVLHALHKEPELRYATPQQFAEDIDHFLQLRPVRAQRNGRFYQAGMFLRRHPVGTLLGLLLAVALPAGLIVSSWNLSRTRRQRDRAEASFQVSRRAVDELFTQINDQPQFEFLGLQPLRATLLENLLRYYENILNLRGNDPGARVLVAEAQRRIARIDHLIGLPDVAAWQLQKAIERYEALISHDPGESRYQDELASILDELGEVLLATEDRSPDALPVLERSRSLLEAGLVPEPKTTSRHRELARVLGHLAEAEVAANHPDRAPGGSRTSHYHLGPTDRRESTRRGDSDRPRRDADRTGTYLRGESRNIPSSRHGVCSRYRPSERRSRVRIPIGSIRPMSLLWT